MARDFPKKLPFSNLPKLRIWHLLVAMTLVGPALWFANETTMGTGEIEVLSVSHADGHYKIEYSWIQPDELSNQFASLFGSVQDSASLSEIELKDLDKRIRELVGRIKFRYRKFPLPWQAQDSVEEKSREVFSRELGGVDEVIISVW